MSPRDWDVLVPIAFFAIVIGAIWLVDAWKHRRPFKWRGCANLRMHRIPTSKAEITEPQERVSFSEVMIAEMEAAKLEKRAVNIDGLARLLVQGLADQKVEQRAAGARLIGPPRSPAISSKAQTLLLPPKVPAAGTFPIVGARGTGQ